ncbi:MAG: NAD(P)-dependent oxidoreductase, partial [Nitrososphaeraceae archaeon]|nr:NAD(P)-dependent oxidoreductase [Nitrososphaeraceae archaeon]
FDRAQKAMGSVDYVYHLAAEFGRLNGEDYYDTLWTTNAVGTKNIIRMQERLGFKMIFASSSEVYGEFPTIPFSENITEKYPLHHQNDYAITKWVNERQIYNSMERYGTKTMITRFFNAYGEGEHYHHYRSVVCLFTYRILANLPITVYKNYKRVFMHVDDLVDTLSKLPNKFKSGKVYNLGGTDYRTIDELVQLLIKYTGKKYNKIKYVPKEKMNVVDKFPDIKAARKDLGHNPKITLEEGLPRTIKWMKETYDL